MEQIKNDGTHKQVIVIRKDLKMKPGKLGAQTAHAAVAAVWSVEADDQRLLPWKNGRFTKACLAAKSEEELLTLHQNAIDAGLIVALIKDSGFTVFNGVPTFTCLAIGPDTLENINAVTGHLPLY